MSLLSCFKKLLPDSSMIQTPPPVSTVGARNEQTRFDWVVAALQNIPEGSRILDAGAGELRYKPYCAHLQYVAQDFAQYDGQGDQKGLQQGTWDQSKLDLVCDISAIPESDASFDAVMCIEVFEHLPEPVLAIKEFARLLKPKGYLILTAPFCSLTHLAPYHFASGFNRYFYEAHLAAYEFDILEIVANGNYFEYLAQELRRIPYCAERYAEENITESEHAAIESVLAALQRCSTQDTGSSEFLCFGYHILAQKRKR